MIRGGGLMAIRTIQEVSPELTVVILSNASLSGISVALCILSLVHDKAFHSQDGLIIVNVGFYR